MDSSDGDAFGVGDGDVVGGVVAIGVGLDTNQNTLGHRFESRLRGTILILSK